MSGEEPDLQPLLEGPWRPALEGAQGLRAERLSRGPHPDSSTVFVVRDGADRPRAVVLCSSPAAPAMVARSMARTLQADVLLAGIQPRRVLTPLAQGEAAGRSCALVPWCQAFGSGRLQRWWTGRRLRRPIFDWLLASARHTRREGAADGARRLQAMGDDPRCSALLRAAAGAALGRMERGAWRVVRTLMHGDLWRGNVMLRSGDGPWHSRLTVIDWSGSQAEGWPFFDLVRFADSIGAGPAGLRVEVGRHADALGCSAADARCAVTAALAETLARLEHFPIDQFVRMGERTLACFDAAVVVPAD